MEPGLVHPDDTGSGAAGLLHGHEEADPTSQQVSWNVLLYFAFMLHARKNPLSVPGMWGRNFPYQNFAKLKRSVVST